MESFVVRYRNLLVLLALLVAQILGLAMQVRRSPPPDAASLVSPTTSEAVDTAFNSLAHTVLLQNARTLEDLVRDMLRPMLKSWLDENLPNVVERLVRAEIERVSRGRA